MSALAGVYSRRGEPQREEALARLAAGLRQSGPDGERTVRGTEVGMVHRTFDTGAASRLAAEPAVGPDGSLAVFAGRLDDFTASGARGTPAELALSAYRQGGPAGLAALVGEFALAIWDGGARRLVLAADALGRAPLYYHATPEHVTWSTRCRGLLHACGLPPVPDDEYVAAFLTNQTSLSGPFAGIRLVPGGHVLICDADATRLERYWAPDPSRKLSHRTDAEYEEHFSALLEEAVACRMRTDSPVFCELSGGLDSSTILAVADGLVKRGEVPAPAVHSISYVFDHANSSDERGYVRAVEEGLGRTGLHLSDTDCPLLAPLPSGFAPDLPTNQFFYISRQERVAREMEAVGGRVLLSGIGGDQLFWSEPPPALPLADLLSEGRVLEMARSSALWARSLRWPLLKTLWVGACLPLLPRRAQAIRQRRNPLGEWLDPAFAARMGLAERALGMDDDLGFRLPSTAAQYGSIRQTMRPFALERCLASGHMDSRYPYLDRRLVEFALALPLEQMVRPHESRSVVRRAFRDRLPDRVRTRSGKSGPTEALHRAFIREWPRLSRILPDLRVAAHGYVDHDAFVLALTRARHGLVRNPAQLNRTLSLEIWLRTLDADGATPLSEPAPAARVSTAVAYADRTTGGGAPSPLGR